MILFPAIDLKDGACVRLVKGDLDSATVYNENPGEQARAFIEMGLSWVHVVDLDGAVSGGTRNEEAARPACPMLLRDRVSRSVRKSGREEG